MPLSARVEGRPSALWMSLFLALPLWCGVAPHRITIERPPKQTIQRPLVTRSADNVCCRYLRSAGRTPTSRSPPPPPPPPPLSAPDMNRLVACVSFNMLMLAAAELILQSSNSSSPGHQVHDLALQFIFYAVAQLSLILLTASFVHHLLPPAAAGGVTFMVARIAGYLRMENRAL